VSDDSIRPRRGNDFRGKLLDDPDWVILARVTREAVHAFSGVVEDPDLPLVSCREKLAKGRQIHDEANGTLDLNGRNHALTANQFDAFPHAADRYQSRGELFNQGRGTCPKIPKPDNIQSPWKIYKFITPNSMHCCSGEKKWH